MYDLTRVTKEFKTICAEAGVGCIDPITLNDRLTKTLGRVHITCRGGFWITTKVEFSKQLIETSTDESILSVIKHEAAHYIVTSRTMEDHGHDRLFKEVCAEIGADSDTTSTKVERIVDEDSLYKYVVICGHCGAKGHYSRMSSSLKNLENCTCKKCKHSDFTLVQNW